MGRSGRIGSWALVGVAALLAGGVPAPAAQGDAAPAFAYVRDLKTMPSIVRSVLARARGGPVLFVFDTVTFDPPPGRSEFNVQHAFADDVPKWIAAIRDETAAGGGANVHVAATTSRRVAGLGEASWNASLVEDLRRKWWDEAGGFEPADRALARLTAQLPAGERVVVLVTGDVLPETWVRHPPFGGDRVKFGPDGVVAGPEGRREPWRSKLSDVGAYWDEERVGSALAAAGARLSVVAPEARFGDFLPLEDVPQAPWAERPVAGGDPARDSRESLPADSERPGGGSRSSEELRRIQEALDAAGLSEQDRRALTEQMRRTNGGDPSLSGRYHSVTPRWCADWGTLQKFFNTDIPSSYGHWPLARAAAKAGGAYYFYPFPPRPWADVCPRNDALVDAMAPELVPVAGFASLRSGDEALAAMLAAQKLVFDGWLWSDGSSGAGSSGGASSWCGFEPGNNARASRWRPREKPYDDFRTGAVGFKSGKGIAERFLEAAADHDRAIEVLARAEARLAEGKLAGTCRRSEANLRLCRFWFETSAFHLQALAIFLAEMERFKPPGGREDELVITWDHAFKLSDCLDAYDGRTITAEDELRYGSRKERFFDAVPGRQSHFLNVAASDPDFRAKRDLDAVLVNLDPRLLPRALRVVDAARNVMAHDARSAWGWVTYYSEVHTYVWVKAVTKGPTSRRGDADDPGDTPNTPGSDGGGTSTK